MVSQMLGLALTRYLLRLPPVVALERPAIVHVARPHDSAIPRTRLSRSVRSRESKVGGRESGDRSIGRLVEISVPT